MKCLKSELVMRLRRHKDSDMMRRRRAMRDALRADGAEFYSATYVRNMRETRARDAERRLRMLSSASSVQTLR